MKDESWNFVLFSKTGRVAFVHEDFLMQIDYLLLNCSDRIPFLSCYAEVYRRKLFFNYEKRIRMRSPPKKWTRFNALLVHVSRCRVKSLLNEDDASEQFCQYLKCERGKLLWVHVTSHDGNLRILCQGLLHIVRFHSLTCTESYCRMPCCSDFKKHRARKERRERKNKERLRRLRETEKHMRALYLSQATEVSAISNAPVRRV